MAESYVQTPVDSTGKKLRTWTGSGDAPHSEAVVLTIANATNAFIDPRFVTVSGASTTLGITGSSPDGSVIISGSIAQKGQWNIRVTGSSPDSAVITSGSVNQLGQWSILATGSSTNAAVLITGSIDRINTAVPVTESGQWNIRATGSSPDGALIISGSVRNLLNTATIGAVQISGSGFQATLTQGSGSDNARYAQDVNVIRTKTFKTAVIAVTSTAGSMNSVITAVTNRHIKVYAVLYNNSGSVAGTWESWHSSGGGVTTQLTGPMPFGINEGYSISVAPPAFLFSTYITGGTLYLSSSQIAVHGGFLSYWDDDLI